MTLPTEDDFTVQQWDALAYARRLARQGDVRLWYRLLRSLCGYRSNRHQLRRHMERVLDEWLARHPGWQGRYIDPDEIVRVTLGE